MVRFEAPPAVRVRRGVQIPLRWQINPEFTGFMRDQQAPVPGELKTEQDDLCLDYNYGNGNVYMHPCHGGANQQWYAWLLRGPSDSFG